MSAAKQHILAKVNERALGNSNRGLLHIASDLLNASDDKWSTIANGTFLSVATLQRVAECVEPYRPQAETLERILRYMGTEVTLSAVKISVEFSNQPKPESKADHK